MVISLDKANKISSNLQNDIVKIAGKRVFINPFLYCRKFDENTNNWLRESGQISEEKIQLNRYRFYPELDWSLLSAQDRIIKDAAIEMFLKSLEIISTFNPKLNSSQMLYVERKMIINKKLAFEKWVSKSFVKKAKIAQSKKRKFQREIFIRTWQEWFSLNATHQALIPLVIIICTSSIIGWLAGISKNSCNPYFESSINNQR